MTTTADTETTTGAADPGSDGDTRDWQAAGHTWVCPCGYGNRELTCQNCGHPNPQEGQ